MSSGIIEHFSKLDNPRVRGRIGLPIDRNYFLMIRAVVSVFDGWQAI